MTQHAAGGWRFPFFLASIRFDIVYLRVPNESNNNSTEQHWLVLLFLFSAWQSLFSWLPNPCRGTASLTTFNESNVLKHQSFPWFACPVSEKIYWVCFYLTINTIVVVLFSEPTPFLLSSNWIFALLSHPKVLIKSNSLSFITGAISNNSIRWNLEPGLQVLQA